MNNNNPASNLNLDQERLILLVNSPAMMRRIEKQILTLKEHQHKLQNATTELKSEGWQLAPLVATKSALCTAHDQVEAIIEDINTLQNKVDTLYLYETSSNNSSHLGENGPTMPINVVQPLTPQWHAQNVVQRELGPRRRKYLLLLISL